MIDQAAIGIAAMTVKDAITELEAKSGLETELDALLKRVPKCTRLVT
jgi:hypothetical protein